MGDDRFLLEEVGVSRTVWNQDKGVEIDFAKKQYRKLSSKPAFVEAQFLHIAGQEGKDSYGMPRSVRVIRETKDDVEWLGIHVIYQPNIDAGLITTYWFDTKTSLISIHIDKYMPSGPEMTRRVKRFDLTPLLSSSDFSPNPPEGFVERNP